MTTSNGGELGTPMMHETNAVLHQDLPAGTCTVLAAIQPGGSLSLR